MLKLFYIKAGDEENNADAFVWAADVDQARSIWAADWGDFDLDRIWELPSAPPAVPCLVDWPEPSFTA